MGYKAAFASIDGTRIDQHFGSARYWQIYDIDTTGGVFVETRKTAAKCMGHCEGGFAHLIEALSDCDAIFVSKIGEGAAACMLSEGKRVFEAAGELDALISQLIDANLLDDQR